VENQISSVEDTSNDLQAVLIDFGQAVDLRHPESMNLLRRDLERVRAFFNKEGVKTLGLEDAVEFVVDDFDNEEAAEPDSHESSENTFGSGSHSSFIDSDSNTIG
jgi:RIO-like serine/threonine protein kinase